MTLGHPKGLFPLFFTEMWERLAFYTMLGVLVLYTTDVERGGLGLPAARGNEIYGLYMAFVYFTPFLGGMIADRVLGYRRAVVLGGVLMAAGLLMMGTPGFLPFTAGLVTVIIGNGFFKPNISVMVGNLYVPGDAKRDAGFNIFYMGINIGAFAANLLAASVRNSLGWLWIFRVAGIGVLIGVVILLLHWKVLEKADRKPVRDPQDTSMGQIAREILLPAFGVGILAYFMADRFLGPDFAVRPPACGFLAGMIPVIVFFVRLGLTAREDERPGLLALLPIYVAGGTFFMVLHLNGSAMTQWARDYTDRQHRIVPDAMQQEALPLYYVNAGEEVPRPHPDSLLVVDEVWPDGGKGSGFESETVARMYGQQRLDETVLDTLAGALPAEISMVRDPDPDEQPQWAARAANVYGPGVVQVVKGTDGHGAPVTTVEVPDGVKPTGTVAFVRKTDQGEVATVLVDAQTSSQIYDGYRERFGHEPEFLPVGSFVRVANAELYQSFNALFVIAFTPLVIAFFHLMQARGRQISTARKLFYGLVLTTMSLLWMAIAGVLSDGGAEKVSSIWLAGFYAIVTLGELCLSPIGLSLVTKLSPKRLVGLTMGGWFMATAFGNNFSGFFGGIQHMMSPVSFFLVLAGLAALAAGFIFLMLPRLDAVLKRHGA